MFKIEATCKFYLFFHLSLYPSSLFCNCMSVCVLNLLLPQVPRFHGCVKIDERLFIRLENISLERKCVMDVKIGFRTWDRWATREKIVQEKDKCKNGEELGYRVLFKVSGFICFLFILKTKLFLHFLFDIHSFIALQIRLKKVTRWLILTNPNPGWQI